MFYIFPHKGEARKQAYDALNSNHAKEAGLFSTFKSSGHNPAVEATYRVAFQLGAAGKPYSDVELFKTCLLEVVQCLEPSQIQKYKELPLSRRTIVRRQEELAVDIRRQLDEVCKQPDVLFSMSLDESCDASDTSQLLIYIRATTSSFQVHEELLAVISMKSTTRAPDILAQFNKVCEEKQLDLAKLVSVCTDGAPAMIGSTGGFVALLTKQLRSQWPHLPTLMSLHCIIHQEALCAKSVTLDNIMEETISIVNFIRSRALNHRQFRQLLVDDNSTDKEDVLYYSNVRWLSKGAVIKRVYELQNNIKEFYSSKGLECKLNNPSFCQKLAFLADLLDHLNGLNTQLQGKGQNVCDLWRFIKVFLRKLKLFHGKFTQKQLTEHFPLLRDFAIAHPTEEVTYEEFTDVFSTLIQEFEMRFHDFRNHENDLRLVSEPHLLEPETVSEMYQMEILELCEDANSRSVLSRAPVDLVSFWHGAFQYPNLRNHARRILTCFGSTYICESTFSHMNYIKNCHRIALTDGHLEDQLLLKTTCFVPCYYALSTNIQAHKSH